MKKILAFLFAMSLMSVAVADEYHDKISNFFISDKEPAVKMAAWDGTRHFKIGIVNDGTTDIDELAERACIILFDEFGYYQRGLDVTVYDSDKVASDNEWVKLGKAYCKH